MSWDNVEGVSSVQIWTDNPDMTQAYLFANGNHQVKLTIGVSLSLSGEGPTYEEVKTALSLIDFETGAGISHLKTGDKGEYAYVYQPNEVSSVKVLDTDASGTGAYQYEVDYYLSSDSTINENYASEKVALLLTYIDGNGNKIDYQTASGSKSQSYVAVTVYPPKKYGTSDSASTPVIITLKDDKPKYQVTNKTQNIDEIEDSSAEIYSLRIDDNYFRIINFVTSNDIPSNHPFYIDGSSAGQESVGHYRYAANEAYIPTDNKINQGYVSYNTVLNFDYNGDGGSLITVSVTVTQEPNELILIKLWGDILFSDETFSNKKSTASFSVVDQFGNLLNIEVGMTDGQFNINSIT